MKIFFDDQKYIYDGSQLRSLHTYTKYKLSGNSILSWIGPCDIPQDKIVDQEDILEGQKIYSEDMLHFIVEIFDAKLMQMVLLQRLVCDLVRDEVYKISKAQISLTRKGDDLYFMAEPSLEKSPVKDVDYKFNISIATVSPVSGLIHFGINISNQNTPVKSYSLKQISDDINIPEFADKIMTRFKEEYEDIIFATQKVNWVK